MSYDGLFLGRIDFEDKAVRFAQANAEMVWKASSNLKDNAELFTSVLPNNYAPPPGLCFDVLCNDDPIIDDKTSPEYNLDAKVYIEYT